MLARAFPVAYFVRRELSARGWTSGDLALAGLGFSTVDWILSGGHIDEQTARELGRVFGSTAQYWLNLQSLYEAATADASL